MTSLIPKKYTSIEKIQTHSWFHGKKAGIRWDNAVSLFSVSPNYVCHKSSTYMLMAVGMFWNVVVKRIISFVGLRDAIESDIALRLLW